MKWLKLLPAVILSLSLLGALSAFSAPPVNTTAIITTQIAPTPATPTAIPTGPPLSLTLTLLCFCLMFLAIIGILILGVVLRKQNMSAAQNEQN